MRSACWSFGEIMKNIKNIVAVLLCLSIVVLSGCGGKDEQVQNISYGFKFPVALYDGVVIEECYLYSGEYVEDGSFDPCENVAAIKVKNSSTTDIQLLRVYVKTESDELFFEITTLTAGSTIVVLEQSKKTIAENEKIIEFRGDNRVDFSEKLSLCEDTFLVQGNPKTINIKNITEKSVDSAIGVYYKKKDSDGNYFGGITFRAVADGVAAGAIKQLPASGFDPADSEIVFVDYAG